MVRTIAVVGPTFPLRGGIAQHTTELAHRLAERVPVSELASWTSQGPDLLTHSSRPLEKPESAPFPRATHDLHWRRPRSWLAVGRRLGLEADALVLILTSPLQFPALATLAQGFRRSRWPQRGSVLLIAHNVAPHEPLIGQGWASRQALRVADHVIVHAAHEAEYARALGAAAVTQIVLPLHGPQARPSTHRERAGAAPVRNQLAFFGFVRPYKGLGDLLTALALASSRPALAVLGEFWEPVERYRQRIEQLGLVDRVTLDVGYASEAAVTELLNSSDALVLPYRTATGSQMPRLAFTHHTPVIATDAGDLAQQVRHGIDGLVCPANDPSSLAGAIDQLYEGTTLTRLRSGVRTPSATDEWAAYLDAVLAAVEPRP